MRALGLCIVLALVLGAPTLPGRASQVAPRLALWMELAANLQLLSTREGVAAALDRARAAGVTVVIPEAKNAWGFVAYESQFAPHIRTSTAPRTMPPVYPEPAGWYPKDYDLLGVLIEEAHARGLEVHAAVNVFGEGLNPYKIGPAFARPHWQTLHLVPGGRLVPGGELAQIVFANPALQEVQLYELAVIDELVTRYQVDGIVLDRARWPDVTADFSEGSRREFEAWLGRPVERWPDDVLQYQNGRLVQGPLFPQWTAWRAKVIQQFVRAAENIVHGRRPQAKFAAYVGAWYPTYWNEGVNWAAMLATPQYPWIVPEWYQAGVADFYDYLMIGLYYHAVTAAEARLRGQPEWMSVEGGALLARQLVGEATRPVGSLLVSLYERDPDRFSQALQRAFQLTAGVMLFDLVYIEQYGWWGLVRNALTVAGHAPSAGR